MNRSPLTASALVLFFVIGVPFALITRLADGLAPLRPMDVPLSVAVIGWLLVARSILARDDTVDSVRLHPSSARFQAHNLVEQSVFGVGFGAGDTDVVAIDRHRLAAPDADIAAALPAPIIEPRRRPDIDTPRRLTTPVVTTAAFEDEDDEIEILATEEYEVCRGDTWWSIAEATLGDGRHWTAVRDLNVGRSVAPGRTLGDDDVPRIGWRVLIPLIPTEAEQVDDHAP